MRRIIVSSFISLDGVMQAPGRADEDPSGGFAYGGWTAPYFAAADDAAGEFMQKYIRPADLLLGRKTFEFFAGYWPQHAEYWPGVNEVTKYVVSTTLRQSDWNNSVFLGGLDDILALRNSDGGELQVHGSGNLTQTLLRHDLVDELWLKTFPVTLGSGKRLFADGTTAAAFELTDSLTTPNGVFFANYKRAGDVQTGVVGPE